MMKHAKENQHVTSQTAPHGGVPVPPPVASGAPSNPARAYRDDVLPLSRTARLSSFAGRAVLSFSAKVHTVRFSKYLPALSLPNGAMSLPKGALLLFSAPLSALAAESAATQNIVLDVAANGGLGALCAAAVIWLNNRRTPRTPPLGEDVARTYATKDELTKCQGICRKDIDDIRSKIDDTDKKAEDRARGTHARIDKIYVEQQKNNKALGMLIGIMVGKGIAPTSTVSQLTNGE